ncbi:MAG TPA: M20/M25/M40 family metallo-hydrolase [Thermoanaerobaculia bacterium]|nr:M20/M25/M40 family metallo-hydrolase [Thermoanaerobaculia bacterium]
MPRSAALIAILLVALLRCTNAETVERDPVEREAEDLLVNYLRIDTSNPPGNETSGAKYLQAFLAKNGIESQLVGADPNRQSLYARLRSGTNEKALLLMHHIDVVPANVSEWTKPPFAGARSGGYIWGRGALDIKSLGVAQLMALVDLKRRNAKLTRDVVLLAVTDEERGGLNGCRDLLANHPELFANVGYVLNEGGSNETVIDAVRFWGIEIQQKVPLWLRIRVDGEGGHAASPPDGGGTLERLVRVLAEIESIETPYRLTPVVARCYAEAARVRTDPRGAMLKNVREPLDIKTLERELPAGYRNQMRDTITITQLNGGGSTNVIPAHASADVDIRLLPDTAPDAMLARIRTAAGKQASVEVLLAGEVVPESPSDTDLFRVVAKAMRNDEPGSTVAPVVGLGTTDSRWFRARGITAYGIAPFKVNYYDAGTVHGVDERIRARFFAEGVGLMRGIVRDFCEKR